MVDHWRAEIARQPHLVQWFFGPDGVPDDRYRAAVKQRFVQWITDACTKPHDHAWLDYQEEIGLRHTPAKKNRTDATQTPTVVPLRYLLGFIAPVVLSVRPFLDGHGFSAAEIDAMSPGVDQGRTAACHAVEQGVRAGRAVVGQNETGVGPGARLPRPCRAADEPPARSARL